MHGGNHLNASAGTAASKWGANSAQYRLIDENETRLFGLSRLDQSFLKRKGLGYTLAAFRNAIALGQLFDDAGQQGLTLSTVHTMKGLEKDIVFLVGMCEGVFPDYRAQSRKELGEELNNAFVAVTRSRRWIYISYPQTRMMPWGSKKIQRPSRFLRLMEARSFPRAANP
jgi:superfamily I DNA/RNA helicase